MALRARLDRVIERVMVLPLFGTSTSFDTLEEAENFIDRFDVAFAGGNFRKFELIVTYSNEEEIRGTFISKERAKEFLRYVPG